MKIKYEEMFPYEFEKAIKSNPTAYLSIGSLEYHGYHNVLGLDSLKAWKICQLIAEKNGGIVFPPIYLGLDAFPDLDLEKYPNKKFDCYHVDEDTLIKVLDNYFYRISRIGFKAIFVLAGHYPNVQVVKKTAEQHKGNTRIIVVKEPDLVEGQEGDHAGKWETSLMMALFPELVNLELMKNRTDSLKSVEGENPLKSSAQYGKRMLDKIVSSAIGKLNS